MILSIEGGESIGAAALVKARCDVVEGIEASESVAVLPGIEFHWRNQAGTSHAKLGGH